MKIIKTQRVSAYLIKTDEYEYNQYTRYGPDSWFITMGMSDEPVCNCDKIESLFQEHMEKYNKEIK